MQEIVRMFLFCKTMTRKSVKMRVWRYRLKNRGGGFPEPPPLELVLRHNMAVPLFNCRRRPCILLCYGRIQDYVRNLKLIGVMAEN